MRHEAAYERRASLLEDVGVGVAVAAMAAAVVVGIGLWYHYVTGAIFILATAILAWHSGFRPALVSTIVSTAALGPLVNALDANATLINMPVRLASIAVISLRRVVAVRQSLPIAGAAADRAVTAAREREFPPADRRAGLGLRVSCADRARRTDRDRFGDERPASPARLHARGSAEPVPASR